MEWGSHFYRVGAHSETIDNIPSVPAEMDEFTAVHRRRIEPWLSAVFQAEHLNLLVGSGFTTAIAHEAGATAAAMTTVEIASRYSEQISVHAANSAERMGRGAANIEDEFRTAIALMEGLSVIDKDASDEIKNALDAAMTDFLKSVLSTERQIKAKDSSTAASLLQSFLLSFASRAASRERLHVFTTNYDRLIEHGCDQAGLRVIDRFVGTLSPVFRASRIEVDYHYNPPGIRGEPRFMEGVIRLTKLHGSLDWVFDQDLRRIRRNSTPFGAEENFPSIPSSPVDTVMIYPNPAKDVETTQYPYAELFRDFASATCRPNAVVVTYGYGFGDDHINRVLLDMLAIPSTHLVIISYGIDDRLKGFVAKTRPAQVTVLAGAHFADLSHLVDDYLPKPALDYISGRMTELLKNRPPAEVTPSQNGSDVSVQEAMS